MLGVRGCSSPHAAPDSGAAGLQGVDSFKLENSVHLCINAADPLANAATVQTASQQPVECRGVVG